MWNMIKTAKVRLIGQERKVKGKSKLEGGLSGRGQWLPVKYFVHE